MKRQVLFISLLIAASTTWVTQPVKAISTGGMKITAVAEGDCAVNSQTIVITDAETSCSISVAITPAKKYSHAELVDPVDKRSTKNGWSDINFMFGGKAYGNEEAFFQISKRGKGLLQFKKKSTDWCTIELTDEWTLVAFVTNSKSAQNLRYSAQAVSKPITIKYQLSIGANDCVARYRT